MTGIAEMPCLRPIGARTHMNSRAAPLPKPIFRGTGDFLRAVRARVDDYFAGRERRDDPRLYRKALIIAVWFVASYVLLLTTKTAWVQLPLCVSYGLAAAALGFNVFHDANHGALSSRPRVNLVLSWLTCTVLGAGRHFWWYKHEVLHHHFTNIHEWDDDIETRGHLRLSPQQPWTPKFRNQHRRFFFLYSVNTLEWFFIKDFVQYFTMRINPHRQIPPMSRAAVWEFWTSKALYGAIFVALPFWFQPAWRVLIGLLLFQAIFSLSLTFVFSLAHAMEKAEHPVPSGNLAVIEDEWAAHQMRTTVNFATDNRLLNWFAGGLNFQIEHHLFPHINHTHYPDISGIVRRTAHEFGLPYNVYDTYLAAVNSHYRIIRELGLEPASAASLAKPA